MTLTESEMRKELGVLTLGHRLKLLTAREEFEATRRPLPCARNFVSSCAPCMPSPLFCFRKYCDPPAALADAASTFEPPGSSNRPARCSWPMGSRGCGLFKAAARWAAGRFGPGFGPGFMAGVASCAATVAAITAAGAFVGDASVQCKP